MRSTFAGCQVPADRASARASPATRRRTALKKDPPFATGPSQGGNGSQYKSIRGSVLWRNSHMEREALARKSRAARHKRGGPVVRDMIYRLSRLE